MLANFGIGTLAFLSSAAEHSPDKRESQGRHLEEGPIGPGALNPNGEGAAF
jgi:hypothetical protein